MKLAISAALAAAALSLSFVAPATAASYKYQTVCTGSNSSETPSGTYQSASGTKWAGFKANGGVPDSIVSGDQATSCTEVRVEEVH